MSKPGAAASRAAAGAKARPAPEARTVSAGSAASAVSAPIAGPAPEGSLPLAHLGNQARLAALCGAGQALPAALARQFERRFGRDLAPVRVHADAAGADLAQAAGARALTWQEHIAFGPGQFRPWQPAGDRLLAHELAHVMQFRAGRGGAVAATRNALEGEAQEAARPALLPGPAPSITHAAGPATAALHDDKRKDESDEELPADPFGVAGWKPAPDAMLAIVGDDKLYLLPAGRAVFTPTDKALQAFRSSSAHVTQDLGTLFEVPASGASGTRIFRAGKHTAMVIDAGYDAAPGQARQVAAVYMNEVMAIARQNNIRKVTRILPIHAHADHVNGMPALVSGLSVQAANVMVPESFRSLPVVAAAVQALTSTTDAQLLSRGFGAGFAPQRAPKDKGGPGALYEGGFTHGELVVDMLALRSALKDARRQTDLGSYLTRVTRRSDGARVVILGDLRGAHLEAIRNAMEAQRPGSWNEFFRGVTTLSGFSHHVGRMQAGDETGMMALLDATLLNQGRLRVVEQSNLAVASQARRDTLELAARLGIELVYTDMPAAGGTSAAGATRDTVYARGPAGVAQAPVSSALTTGMARLQSLQRSRLTLEQWRPWLEELNGKAKIDALVGEIDSSMRQLQRGLRGATAAAVGVRTETRPAGSSGARDYSATAGGAGRTYAAAEAAIPVQTAAERSLSPALLRGLQTLRERNIEEIPLNVAVYRAVTRGEFSNQAFTHMMGQLHPRTRDELIGRKPGSFGANVPRLVAFERVRAQFGFERSVSRGETMSIRHLSPGGQVRARGVGGALLVAELWSSIGQPLYDAHQISKQVNVTRNLMPFVRRIAFWQKLDINPSMVGVSDPTFGSPDYYRDPATVVSKLQGGDLDAIFIEKPAFGDAEVLRLAAWLSMNIRNYDEYATLFEDSYQDALRFRVDSGKYWSDAHWDVRVGHYETEGSNHVEDQWYEHPKLTEMMRHYIPWLIANTNLLIEQERQGGSAPVGFHEMLGTMAGLPGGKDATPTPRVRLRDPKQVPIVSMPPLGRGDSWNPAPSKEELAHLKVPGDALFFVLGRRGSGDDEELKVSGANFETYAAIRDLRLHRYTLVANQRSINELQQSLTRNETGWVWIDAVHTEPLSATPTGAGVAQPQPQPTPAAQPDLRLRNDPGSPVGGPRDVVPGGPKLPLGIGPKVFGPGPNDAVPGDDKSRSVLPGIGGRL